MRTRGLVLAALGCWLLAVVGVRCVAITRLSEGYGAVQVCWLAVTVSSTGAAPVRSPSRVRRLQGARP